MAEKVEKTFLLNRRDTAELFRITPKTLDSWKLPKVKQGRETFFDIRKVYEFRMGMLTNAGKLNLQEEQARLAKSRREKIDLEIEVQRGTLIAKAIVENSAFKIGRTIRDAIMNIPDRVSGVLAAESSQENVHQILSKENREALESLTEAPYA